MDLVDLIDENDNVIGAIAKQTAHDQHLAHRVAAVFVFNQNDELLVQLHKKSGKLDHSAAGHLHHGETYEQAAKRELSEELGIVRPLKKLFKIYSSEDSFVHMFELYECRVDDGWAFKPNDEVEQIIPMKLTDIQNQIAKYPNQYSTDFKLAIANYCNQIPIGS